jgi:hypothetical protein
MEATTAAPTGAQSILSTAPSTPSATPAASSPPAASGDWFSSLPADLASDSALAPLKGKGVNDLAKGYVHAQRMIGADKIVLPKDGAPPEEWGTFWNRLGRPETPDGYKIPEKLPDGVKIDEAEFKAFSAEAHRLGFNSQQVAALARYDAERKMAGAQAKGVADQQAMEATVAGLRKDWGQAFDQNIAVGREAAVRFGGEDAMKDPSLANNPTFIRMMAKIGKAMAQDEVTGTGGRTAFRMSPNDATAQIAAAQKDPKFVAALTNRRDPEHESAKAKWAALHSVAYPGTEPVS